MDLITEVVNARLPINTKCKVKIAMIEQKRIALKRKITMAMVTDFKVTTLDEKVTDRIKRSWLPDQPQKSLVTALLINALVGGDIGYGWADNGGFTHFNVIEGEIIDLSGAYNPVSHDVTLSKDCFAIYARERLIAHMDHKHEYDQFVNRYMRNFMEEIK